jgi:citrate lyase subunit beta/citryl-CoA lyase
MERSWLFVPGDSERKMTKAEACGADILILDLEDSVAAENTATARGLVREYLKSRADRQEQKLWVRINPLATPMALADLAGVMPGAPDGILLPKPDTAGDVTTLGHYLDAFEAASGLGLGTTRIMPVATETALGMFQLGAYRGLTPRLAGLTWGAEDLAAALGAGTNRRADGTYAHTYEMARSLCLLGAVAQRGRDRTGPPHRRRLRQGRHGHGRPRRPDAGHAASEAGPEPAGARRALGRAPWISG